MKSERERELIRGDSKPGQNGGDSVARKNRKLEEGKGDRNLSAARAKCI